MHLTAGTLLFATSKRLGWAAAGAVGVFYLLLPIVPFETGWDFGTLRYTDFWTPAGFLRNTFYNGWNPVFPWLAFFLVGMILGRSDWTDHRFRLRLLGMAAGVWLLVQVAHAAAERHWLSEDAAFFVTADYLPPFLPFQLGTGSSALMVVVLCTYVAERAVGTRWLAWLCTLGQHTLTHYVAHTTLGMVALAAVRDALGGQPVPPWGIAAFSALYFLMAMAFSAAWTARYRYGPLEGLLRRISTATPA
jgi:uncharacterized membrane protein YeiB